MTLLYTPPTWRNVVTLEGSLRVGFPVSVSVYRQGGVWAQVVSPGPNVFDVPIDVDPSGLTLLFTRPTVVPNSLSPELTLYGLTPADPSWTAGTLT